MANKNGKQDEILYTLVQIKETHKGIKQLGEDLSEPRKYTHLEEDFWGLIPNDWFETIQRLFEYVPCYGVRHTQVLIGFFAIFISYGIRSSLSVAIVAMTDSSVSSNKEIPTYSDWPVSLVLSSFFWGYILPQSICGWATSQFGAKWLLISSVSLGSALGFLIPWTAAHFGYLGVCILRAAQGLFLGCIMPGAFYILSQWVPPSERARLGSISQAGVPVGTVFSLVITGALSGSRWGWPVVFYFYSTLGLIWCAAMAKFGYDRPADHPHIGAAEKFYVEVSLGHVGGKKQHKTPWNAIFKSPPVWALLAMQSGSLLLFYTLLAQIPTYMNHVMKFSISNNSMLSAIPFVLYWILSIFTSWICDYIINQKYVSTTTARKLFNSIGLLFPALALVHLGYTDAEDVTQGVILMMVAVSINSTITSGWGVNHIDLAPNHTGTLVGLLGTLANSTGFIGPMMVQYIVKDLSDPSQWRIVFLLIAGCSVLVVIIYCIWGSGEVQPWNEDDNDEYEKDREAADNK